MTVNIGAAGATSAARGRRTVNVSRRGTIYKQGLATVDATGSTTRQQMPLPAAIQRAGEFVVRLATYGWGGSQLPTVDLLYDVALEHPIGKPFRGFFNGAQTVQAKPGSIIDSDPIGLDLLGGQNAFPRTFVRTVSGSGSYLPTDWATDTGTLTWELAGDHLMDTTVDLTTPGANPGPFLPQRFICTPVMLLARAVLPAGLDVVAGVGDSLITRSTSDSFPERAAAALGGLPYTRLSSAGQGVGNWVAPTTSTSAENPSFVMSCLDASGATVLFLCLGTNDTGSSMTGAQIAAALNTFAAQAKARLYGRAKVIVVTVPPNTTSASTTITTPPASQVVGAQEAKRAALNTAIRAGLSNVDWLCDCATAVEVDAADAQVLNGTRWHTGMTDDGTHYSTAGHAAATVLATDALTKVLAGQTGGVSKAF